MGAVPDGRVAAKVLEPTDPLTLLHGIGEKFAARLGASGLHTVRDLLMWFPRRHAAIDAVSGPAEEWLDRLVRIQARVEGSRLGWLPGRRSMVTVRLTALGNGATFEVRFFNQPYLKKAFPDGSQRWTEGVLEQRGQTYRLAQGRIFPAGLERDGSCLLGYGEIPGVSATRIAGLIGQALPRVDLNGWDQVSLPPALAATVPSFADAVRGMHLPADAAEHERARLRFALSEAVVLFRRVESARRRRCRSVGPAIRIDRDTRRRIEDRFPFPLTPDQSVALAAIHADLRGPAPMGALLQGDVGTGKTAVALGAAFAALDAGYQVAFLAPTELLAEQHFSGAARLFGAGSPVDAGFEVGLLTASVPASERGALETVLAAGTPTLVFGTHALFSDRTRFDRLGLVIIDEQHRFGVAQRTRLVAKGERPHVLYMTATPIPRTLTLTVFGDLDLRVLRGRPPGHRAVPAFHLAERALAWRRTLVLIARRLARGQQVFVVCPKIGADGEKGGAVRMHRDLAARFPSGLVHGQMPGEERQRTLAGFRAGEFGVLVGTTVLEVGVDVPNATLIVVTGVDRFGLATLHQLRGRVGRGSRRGLCILVGPPGPRVRAICDTADGFDLAERDLALRGAGELLGTRQSGLGDLRALDPVRDVELLCQVRSIVRDEERGGAGDPE